MYQRQPVYAGYQYGQTFSSQQLVALKNNQITQLFQSYPNARSMKQDNSIIDVPLALSNGGKVTFRITLKSNFPQSAPVIQLLAKCAKYAYLDPRTSTVIHVQLSNWNVRTSNLAMVCKMIFTQFITYPPTILSSGNTMGNQMGNQMRNQMGMNNMGMRNNQMGMNQIQQQRIRIPNIPNNFNEVSRIKSTAEIEELLNDSAKLNKFINNLTYTKTIDTLISSIKEDNVKVAKGKIQKDRELKKKEQDLAITKSKISELQATVDSLNKKRGEIQQQYQPKFIIQKLDSLIRKSDRAVDEYAEKFMDGDVKPNAFIKKVMEDKTLTHIRKQKRVQFSSKYMTK